jgi:diguanylate cyclase (GGDEF)-like protein
VTSLERPADLIDAGWARLADLRPRSPQARLAVAGSVVVAVFFALSWLDIGGQGELLENLEWTVAAAMATLLAVAGAYLASGLERTVRALLGFSLVTYLLGTIARDSQALQGTTGFPGPPDVLFLASIVPAAAALVVSIRGRLEPGGEVAAYLDTLAVGTALATFAGIAYVPVLQGADPLVAAVVLAYPIGFLSLAVLAHVTGVAARLELGASRSALLAVSWTILGLAWAQSLSRDVTSQAETGSLLDYAFSFGVLVSGWAAGTWTSQEARSPLTLAWYRWIGGVLPFAAVTAVLVALLLGDGLLSEGAEPVIHIGVAALVMIVFARQALLLRERNRMLGAEVEVLAQERLSREETMAALQAQRESQTRYRAVVEVFNHLSEQITFAADEKDLVKAGVAALGLLVPTRHGDVLLSNPSQDRLVVAASWGWHPAPIGSAVQVDSPLRCPGIRRGSVHQLRNAGDILQLACPAHPARSGSVMCVPMLALGQVVGTLHLGRSENGAFSEDDERQAARIAEQIALAISNVRLARSMQGMAMSDALTGLHNARFLDPFLERELSAVDRDGPPIGLLMIDIDHFKDFNDRFGHPAGDDALRAFARTMRETLRESDTIARYGGEEFLVALLGADLEAARSVAEKLRLAAEQMVIELGPSRFARITISVGVASSSVHGTDRRLLLKAADEALYQAKESGRNRVVTAPLPYRRQAAPKGAARRKVAAPAPARAARAKRPTKPTRAKRAA